MLIKFFVIISVYVICHQFKSSLSNEESYTTDSNKSSTNWTFVDYNCTNPPPWVFRSPIIRTNDTPNDVEEVRKVSATEGGSIELNCHYCHHYNLSKEMVQWKKKPWVAWRKPRTIVNELKDSRIQINKTTFSLSITNLSSFEDSAFYYCYRDEMDSNLFREQFLLDGKVLVECS